MIERRIYREGHLEPEPVDRHVVDELMRDPSADARVWVDVEDPQPSDFTLLGEEFGLHELSLEDMHHRNQRPKVEGFAGYDFLVVRPLSTNADGDLQEHELHVLAGERFLVTIRYGPTFDLTEVVQRWDRQASVAAEGGSGFLLYVVLDQVVDAYLGIVERLEDRADDLEDAVFSVRGEEAGAAVQQELFRLKRQTVLFRRHVMPLRRVVDFLQEQPDMVTAAMAPYYRDVADHVIRSVELVDNVRDVLTSLLEVRVAQVANHLNEVMKKLTSWAGIILVPTLIAGVYGMNFRMIPELRWAWGYPFALTLMAGSALALYVVFKRKDWL